MYCLILVNLRTFVFADYAFFVAKEWGAYKRGKNTCARTWRSNRGGGLFSGGYGNIIIDVMYSMLVQIML